MVAVLKYSLQTVLTTALPGKSSSTRV